MKIKLVNEYEKFKEVLEEYKRGELTQEEAGCKCGITQTTFSRWMKKRGVKVVCVAKKKLLTYTNENGELVQVKKKSKKHKPRMIYYQPKIDRRKKKNEKLDEKIKLAKELGVSYGKYVAMKKMGVI